MVIINRPADQKFLTNSETLEWIRHYSYNRKLPPIAKQIYDFWLYRKLISTFNQEDQYSLSRFIEYWGFSKGIEMCIMEVKSCLSWRRHIKDGEMQIQTMHSGYNATKLQEEINEHLEEEKYEQGLTLEEVELRDKPYPGGIMNIPEEILLQQSVIHQGEQKDVKYWVFNKTYGCWSAAITSPHRERPGGSKGCVILRDNKLKELKNWLKTEIIKEQERQDEFMREKNKKPNIQRVQRIMGVNRNTDNNLNHDDIF